MKISVRSSAEAWKSPDGKITIWDVIDGEGATWQTMSGKIANAIGQTIDVTTRTNTKGKTYLITPPQDGVTPLVSSQSSPMSEQTLARFESAVAAFSDAVDRLTGKASGPHEKPGVAFDAAMEIFGNDIVDDLR